MGSDRNGPMDPTDVLSEAEAAEYLRTSERKLRRLRARGEITFARVGKTPVYRVSWCNEYLDRNQVTAQRARALSRGRIPRP